MHKHNYAHQLLKYHGLKIFSGNSQILQYDSLNFTYNVNFEYTTRYALNRHLSISNQKVVQIERYEDLLQMGYQVSKRRASGVLFSGQKIEYFLVKNTLGHFDMGVIPPGHIIEYNNEDNWLRLVGNNSRGSKVLLTRRKGTYHKELELEDYKYIYEDYIQDISPWSYEEEEKFKFIDEIPLILTADGKLVCLPKTKDMPTIGIFGKKGMGKTLFLHYVFDCVYLKWKKRCMIMNDGVSFQTKSWSLPWNMGSKDAQKFTKKSEFLGHDTMPTPCVYLFPNTDTLKNVELEGDASYRITLPFRDIISNYSTSFFGNIESLGDSGKYLDVMIHDDKGNERPDGLIHAKSIEDIHDLINEQIIEEQGLLSEAGIAQKQMVFRIPHPGVRGKLYTLLREVFNSRIFDANTGINSKWILETPAGEKVADYPWRVLLQSDLVPVMVTQNIRFHKSFPAYYSFILNDLFKMQSEDRLIKKNNIEFWGFMDEIHSLLSYPAILNTFMQVNKEARPNRMAWVYATQYFGDIPPALQLTTDIVVAFQQTADEGTDIFRNFRAMKHEVKSLRTLPKLNAMVVSASIPLIIYDTEGNRQEVDDGTPFKGIIFPSISQHMAPKSEGI